MDDPVIAADGVTYDRAAIEEWFETTKEVRACVCVSLCVSAWLAMCERGSYRHATLGSQVSFNTATSTDRT